VEIHPNQLTDKRRPYYIFVISFSELCTRTHLKNVSHAERRIFQQWKTSNINKESYKQLVMPAVMPCCFRHDAGQCWSEKLLNQHVVENLHSINAPALLQGAVFLCWPRIYSDISANE